MRASRLAACALLAGAACAAPVPAAAVSAPAPASAAGAVVRDPGCGTLEVVTREGVLVYRLGRTFLRAGSDSVSARGVPLAPGRDYALDPLRGELRLLRPRAAGETLRVAACWLLDPPPLERHGLRYRPPGAARAESAAVPATVRGLRAAVARDPAAAPPGASLAVNGNKTIAVDFGSSQDAFLRQSLDLAVSGTLAPGVSLTGVLSDRNTPLTAQGSTQSLQALDRVLIELRAPRGAAALGDVSLGFSEGDFARLERRLQGATGEATFGATRVTAAAASAQGEYHRLQFFGVDGRQGPYRLTDRDGNPGVAVVAGSEAVTLDGARLARGEAADYFMDYERGELTFTNRRPISSASRITVDYQFAVNRYRRNLVAFDGGWRGARGGLWTRVLHESDDRGRPLDVTLGDEDRLVLAAAGDSAALALAPGVTSGRGDYDTVRVAGVLRYAFAGPDSGAFAVRFARVGAGRGDYADSASVAGRTAFRYVGAGQGAFRIGRALPLPETQSLWAAGGGGRLGALAFEAEGAVSRRDRNTASALDDADNTGVAGRLRLGLEGRLPDAVGGTASFAVQARGVSARFAPFTRLERPFEQEDWGLAPGADLERQRRVDATLALATRAAGALRAFAGALRTPGGFESLRRGAEWSRDATLAVRAAWERAEGRDPARRFARGGRDRLRGELRLRLPWLEPAVRAEADERTSPADSGRVGERSREGALELATGRAARWRALGGLALRRDAALGPDGFRDRADTRSARLALDSPADAALGVAASVVRREVEPTGEGARTRSDLASLRVRGEDRARGLSGTASLEVTSEGSERRSRTVTFVGAGRGAYDAFGNFVGVGDHDLGAVSGGGLERVSRAALSARAAWRFGASEAWRGSRVEFAFEGDARRRGELRGADLAVAPGAALGDPGLARGSVLQRLEAELAPGSATAAVRLRAERRVAADRAFENFAQATDDRIAALRWRVRPAASWTAEWESRLKRQEAAQSLAGAGGYRRVVTEGGGALSVAWTPDPALRAVATVDAAWSRPEGGRGFTRIVRAGPDVGRSIGARGRIEVSARRAFVSGPAPVGLLPGPDPAGGPRWEASARADVRVRESTTVGLTVTSRAFAGRAAQTVGRAEVRAFF